MSAPYSSKPVIVLSLCDRTGVIVRPWQEAGYECHVVDLQHQPGRTVERGVHKSTGGRTGDLVRHGADLRRWWLPPQGDIGIVFAFPPCTNLAGSGARWFTGKGLRGLIDGLETVESCRDVCEWSGAPWMLENPVGTLSTYWRKPDFTFQPWEYGDTYTKKTCLWTGGGFAMPQAWHASPPDGTTALIHLMPPSADRADKRSITPAGFARAVFEANEPRVRERAA